MPFHHLLHDPVLALLLLASLVSWAIILDRLLALHRVEREDHAFQQGKTTSASPLAAVQAEAQRHAGAGRDHLATLLDAAITLQRQRVERGLPLLGVIGSTAPYVGLLGTVVGIIQAFQSIQAQNNMSPSVVAGGIATALIATAMGLGVAIPAVTAHHLFAAAISRLVSRWESVVAAWLPDPTGKEAGHEPVPFA